MLPQVNETPNMGLEVNYHPQYGAGSAGEKIEKRDFEYKRIMMEDLLQVRNEEGKHII